MTNLLRPATPLALLLALLVAAPAGSSAGSPIPGGVECVQKPKERYRIGAVARRGIAIDVECTGPARVGIILQFAIPSRADDDLLRMFPGGIPGIAAGRGPVAVPESGGATVRLRMLRFALKIVRRYRRTPVIAILAVEREDGSFVSVPSANRRFRLVR